MYASDVPGREFAPVILVQRQIGGGEVALRPVAHDHQRGLVGLHQRERVVPFAIGAARIDVLTQPSHHIERGLDARAACHLRIVIDRDRTIDVAAADTRQQRHEQPTLLLCIRTEGDRDVAGGLQLGCRSEKLVPTLRRLQLQLLEDLRAVEHPVGAVDIDRRTVDVAINRDVLQQERRQGLFPMPGLGQPIEVSQQPLLRQFACRRACLPLHSRRRIAARDPVHRQRCLGLRPHGRIVDPLAAALVIFPGEHRDRSELAATGPEVDDIGRLRRSR